MTRVRAALIASLLAFTFAGTAQALNELELTPPPTVLATESSSFDLLLEMAFDDTTVGGGVTVGFDAALLQLDSIVFDAGFPDDPLFRCPGAPTCPPDPNFISFGSFSGIVGEYLVATLGFTALAQGLTDVTLTVTSPFSDLIGGVLPVSTVGTTVQVVPEPSTALLLGLALLGTGVSRRARAR